MAYIRGDREKGKQVKRIKAHSLFKVWSPDEVAECLSIGSDLYAKIWNELVPLYANKPRSEVPDDFGSRNLSKWWSKFSDEEKLALNEAAKKYDEEWKNSLQDPLAM